MKNKKNPENEPAQWKLRVHAHGIYAVRNVRESCCTLYYHTLRPYIQNTYTYI